MIWLIFGGAAFLLAIFNLIRSCMGKRKGWQVVMFASLSCGAAAVLEEYRMVNTWLGRGDIAAVLDVVPTLIQVLTAALYTGIAMNLIVLIRNIRKERGR